MLPSTDRVEDAEVRVDETPWPAGMAAVAGVGIAGMPCRKAVVETSRNGLDRDVRTRWKTAKEPPDEEVPRTVKTRYVYAGKGAPGLVELDDDESTD